MVFPVCLFLFSLLITSSRVKKKPGFHFCGANANAANCSFLSAGARSKFLHREQRMDSLNRAIKEVKHNLKKVGLSLMSVFEAKLMLFLLG